MIDQYKHDELLSLDGCKNDGKNVYDYLTNTLQVPESNIRLIADDGATREAILSEFKNHLILNNEIRKGDCMLFFYSGHGTRIQAPTEWFAVNDLVEAICPYDEGTIDSNGNTIFAIPDCTFDGLMRELASQKGDNIVRLYDFFSGYLFTNRCFLSFSRWQYLILAIREVSHAALGRSAIDLLRLTTSLNILTMISACGGD